MTTLAGTYINGQINLEKDYYSTKPVKVIVTFMEDVEEEKKLDKRLILEDFSFLKTRRALEHYKGSFSDAVIEERRSEL